WRAPASRVGSVPFAVVAQLVEQALEVARQRRAPDHQLPVTRMPQRQLGRVQRLAREGKAMARAATVHHVADQRVTDMLEVNADLVRAPRFQPAFDQRRAAEALQDAKRSARRLAAVRYRHANPRADVAAHRGIDHSARRRIALHDREVHAAHRPIGELLREVGLRGYGFRHHQQAARVLVETVDDAGPWYSGQGRRMRQQRVEKRAVRLARARMHDQARRLVDHDQLRVFVHHLERHAQRLYGEAKDAMNAKEWQKAIKLLEKLEARYPYGRFAQQAQLEVAYAQYKDSERALAIAAADRFIKLYPNHPNVDYAYYLKGL